MTPNSTVTLYATDFDISNKHVVYAPDEGAAFAAVSSFPSITFTNCYWQRTDGFIFRCNGNINEIEKYNYCIFINNGKRNYAFITKCQYVNDAMTWVYLEIDPWLNFAGQYIFYDSPMVRCHPKEDSEYKPNTYSEPVGDIRSVYVGITAGEKTGTLPTVNVVTAVASNPIAEAAEAMVNEYWDGLLTLYQQSSVDLLKSWSARLQPKYTTIGNSYSQPCTSILPANAISQIANYFLQNGLGNLLLGAYVIPEYFGASLPSGPDLSSLPSVEMTINLPTAMPGTVNWQKTKYSPQFHDILVNITGNTKQIPIDIFPTSTLTSGTPIPFRITADPGINGCATITPTNTQANVGRGNYSVQSARWDRIQMVGQGIDTTTINSQLLSTVGGAAQTAFSLVGNALTGNILGAVSNTTNFAISQGEQRIVAERTAKDSVSTVGTPITTIASYNLSHPLIEIRYSMPITDSVKNIETIFGTYGYMQGDTVQPIIFNNYPYWNYYQTVEAAITGREVPQYYLSQVIAMFNRGVFIFNDISNYKDFSKALDNHL